MLNRYPEHKTVISSAPCRLDLGGTLDIPLMHYTLRYLNPCTLNIALNMRTQVTLKTHTPGQVKISSKGFEPADFPADQLPFDHPLGLMFAIASYFRVSGVHIHIESDSPPRSALGGSSTAAVAIIAALSHALEEPISLDQMALLAYQIESNVARVSCGIQDQLAAVFGGINAWYFKSSPDENHFRQEKLVSSETFPQFEKNMLVAYCGAPHESKDINGQWINQFLKGNSRNDWEEIIRLTHQFVRAIKDNDWYAAVSAMNLEVTIRLQMTPEVLDPMGKKLFQAATDNSCAARFTGAGGGGCIWAIGEEKHIDTLEKAWASILTQHPDAKLLPAKIADCGVIIEGEK